ncbi:nuclear transport factor 2 family protein [Halopseudomonas sp.]|uniref:nuclear transport factor 2 family protein n=1 Tax=Halopseudomonas sp. TaxID=2901191 RepID=UPI003001B97A
MTLSLPDAVSTCFDIINGGDPKRVNACFRPDATVTDENQRHQGLSAIESWQRETRQAFTYKAEPLAAATENGVLNVRARLTGDFPGSPVQLDHVFVLEQGMIQSLEIKPS